VNNEGKAVELLYALPSGKLRAQLPPLFVTQQSMESCRPIAFTWDEGLVALFSRDDGTIHVLDTATGKLHQRLGRGWDQPVQGDKREFLPANLAFSRDSKLLASWWMMDKLIRVWDLTTGKELLQIVPDEPGTKTAGPPGNQQRVHFAWSPDGRMLALGQSKIRLLELATLGVRRQLPGHADGLVRALAYSPDGRILASGSADTTVLIWDVSLPAATAATGVAADRGELSKHWQALAEDDAAKAYAAIGELAALPAGSVPWIKERIKPSVPLDSKRVEDLIGQLNDPQFKIRQKATTDLLRLGERVVPALDKVLAGKPALETHLRLQDLRKRLAGLALQGERLQAFRAVEVLEHRHARGPPSSRGAGRRGHGDIGDRAGTGGA
jgi:hypothetical protein